MKTKAILFLCVLCLATLLPGTQEVKAQKTKIVSCSDCGGRGYNRCSLCNGSGRTKQIQRGRSTTSYVSVTCTSCRGNGRTSCWSCGGRGGFEEPDYSQPDATIERIWVDHDTTEDDEEGMRIHVKFSAAGLKNKKGIVIAYFYYSNGTPLEIKDGYYGTGYNTTSGYISKSREFEPPYDDTSYSDFKLFVPYYIFDLASGSHSLKFEVQVRTVDGAASSYYLDQDSYSFTYNKK